MDLDLLVLHVVDVLQRIQSSMSSLTTVPDHLAHKAHEDQRKSVCCFGFQCRCKHNAPTASASASTSSPSAAISPDNGENGLWDQCDNWAPGDLDEIDRIEREALRGPFYSTQEAFAYNSDTEDEGMESQNEDDASGEAEAAGSQKDAAIGATQWLIRVASSGGSARQKYPRVAPTAIRQPPAGIFGGWSHQMTQRKSAIGWLQWLHRKHSNTLQLQYLESIFELERGADPNHIQPNIHAFSSETFQYPTFGDFGSPNQYNAFVPTVPYLSSMMNKAIEREEADADQHTACQSPENLCIDDSHKVNKHIANVNGVPIFGAMWTCMGSFYIRAQALTLTKGHEERLGPLMGIAASAKRYGYSDPAVVYSDDPMKHKAMLLAAFPSLAEKLTPMAAAHGLKSLTLPTILAVNYLGTVNLVESALSSLIAPLDIDPRAHLCVSLDAEWNISRQVGVSILQIAAHSEPDIIYIIPVHRFQRQPTALLRLLISQQVFLIGSAIKGDLTRLKKQCPQLVDCSMNVIDLKQFAIRRGIIKKNSSGSLEKLAEKALDAYLPKEATFRKSEEWETDLKRRPDLLNYAALDVFASRLIFEKITEIAPLDLVQRDTPAGTRVALLVHEGGDIAAYGRIASLQPATFSGVRNSGTRIIIDIDVVVLPSAAAILHLDPSSSSRTKSGALSLSQLKIKSGGRDFQLVAPLALLEFDRRPIPATESASSPPQLPPPAMGDFNAHAGLNSGADHASADVDGSETDDESDTESNSVEADHSAVGIQMVEAHGKVSEDSKGKKRAQPDDMIEDEFDSSPLGAGLLEILCKLAEDPADIDSTYTRIKKDIFHAFHMILHTDYEPSFSAPFGTTSCAGILQRV
ncbi:hypothetical protein B0H13DRAFT_2367672 [Mycena leptocephala]|nr:hypothetical protein B0H13DRAFT_2367672 [Mycena leptocephala]